MRVHARVLCCVQERAPDGAVDYGPDDPVDYASGARCGLRGFATVDFPALRARAHLSTPDGAVDEWISEE